MIAALLLAIFDRKLSIQMLKEVFEGTVRTTSMLTEFVNGLGKLPMASMLVIIAMCTILGFFVETLSLMVITILIVAPVITGLGFDPVWLGVLLILLIEMTLIMPPVG